MRAILIDPEKRTISEIDFGGGLDNTLAVIGCHRFAAGSRPLTGSLLEGFDTLRVSDDYFEDRDPDPRYWFQVDANRDPPSSHPLAGRGLVVGIDERGEDCDARISVAELTSRITFTQRKFRGFEVSPGRGQIGDHLVELMKVDLKAPIIDGTEEEEK